MRNEMLRKGFTIVELLTVMAVIAILIGLLVPALSMVKEYSKEIEQKAQFHSIEVGIEMFKTEFGMYPPSNDNSIAPVDPDDDTPYGGAQKLAESLVGLDFLGFHPNSDFRSDGTFSHVDDTGTIIYDAPAYHPSTDYDGAGNELYVETATENIEARKRFIELENANAYRMEDVWQAGEVGDFLNTSVVLCDVYSKKRPSTKKTGMPILYYRARSYNHQQDYRATPESDGIEDDIYYYWDNYTMLELGTPGELVAHPIADGTNDDIDFENMILNRQVTDVKMPYRANSYILISAGPDGIYGNSDDITNYSKAE